MTFLAVVSSQLPPFDVVYPVFFLNSITKIYFIRVSPPGWCHPGRSAPPPVTPLFAIPKRGDSSAEQLIKRLLDHPTIGASLYISPSRLLKSLTFNIPALTAALR